MAQDLNTKLSNPKRILENFVTELMTRVQKPIDYYVVEEINDNLSVKIKRLNDALSYDNAEVLGQGIGNVKGLFVMPQVNDIVVVGFINNSETPFIFGSILFRGDNPDNFPALKSGEVFVAGKTNGSFVYINQAGDITLKNTEGNVTLNADGTFTINDAFTFPKVDGSSGQVLKTNGSGVLTWQNDETV